MNGIDEEFALLQTVRADLSANRKTITDEAHALTAEEMAFLQSGGARQYAFLHA